MNQSKQKADALAKAVREYMNLPFGDNPSEAKLIAAVADYEASGAEEDITMKCKHDIPLNLGCDKCGRYESHGSQHAPTEPALPACEWCNGAGVLRSLGRDNDEVIEDCPKCAKAKPATGEQPGADWMRLIQDLSLKRLAFNGSEHVEAEYGMLLDYDDTMHAINAYLAKHAPASPAPAEVSADSARLDWLDSNNASVVRDNHGKPYCGNPKMFLWAEGKTARKAIDGAMQAERADKAKEPHA
jgi:hypothetical protein